MTNKDTTEIKLDVDFLINNLKKNPEFIETLEGSENWDQNKKKEVAQKIIQDKLNSEQAKGNPKVFKLK